MSWGVTIVTGFCWILVLIASFSAKVKGTVLLLIFLLGAIALQWTGKWVSADLMSVIDSFLFLLLLLWIVTINKHSIRRPK